MTQTITLIEGDGIGLEISAQVVRVLQALQLPLTFDRQTLGQTALEQTGMHDAGWSGLPQRQRPAASGV